MELSRTRSLRIFDSTLPTFCSLRKKGMHDTCCVSFFFFLFILDCITARLLTFCCLQSGKWALKDGF